VDTGLNVPQNFMINMDIDGNDVWIATAKGVAWGIGEGYYPGVKERPLQAFGPPPSDAPKPGAGDGTKTSLMEPAEGTPVTSAATGRQAREAPRTGAGATGAPVQPAARDDARTGGVK